MIRKIICALLAASFLGAIVVGTNYRAPEKPNPDLQDLLNMPKTALQLQLYGANKDAAGKSASGKTLGFEYYKDNGRHKYWVHNIFENGAIEDIFLRPDGTKERANEYFPLRAGEDLPLLNGRAEFAADGKTYTSHDVYNDNGVLVRQGRLLESGLYQQTYFCEGGTKVQRLRLFDTKREFQSEKLYDCKTGVQLAEILPGAYSGQVKVHLLRADGSLLADLTRDWQGVGGNVFAEDGKTITAWFRTEYSSQTVRYFSAPDKLSELRITSFGRTTITHYNQATEKRTLVQVWKERDGEAGEPKRQLLVKSTEFDGQTGEWTKEIEMSSDGKFVEKVLVPLPKDTDLNTFKLPTHVDGMEGLEKLRSQMRIVKTLNADGKVLKTELAVEYQSWHDTVQPPASVDEYVRVTPKLTSMPEAKAMPSFDDLGPDRVYDYETGTDPRSWPSSYQQPYYGGHF